jgi:DNA-binding transcriptional LysR family regulator
MNIALDTGQTSAGVCDHWGLLRCFYFIGSQGGVTRAAKAQGLSQPSVSASLTRLETRLGQQLVQRGQRDFELTAAGEVLFTEVERMFRAALRAEQKLKALHSDLAGSVQLQIVTGVRSAVLDEILRLVHQRHPSVVIDIQIASSPTIVHNVVTGSVPFGVCLMAQPLSRLDCQLILRAEYGIFCGTEDPLFGRKDVPLDELRDMPFIAFSCDAEGRAPEPMIAVRDGLGLGRRISGTSNDFNEVCRMITAGVGIGVLPVHAVGRAIAEETLWRIELPKAQLFADMFFVSDSSRDFSAAERMVLSIVKEVINAPH